jgi:hypothetical protein
MKPALLALAGVVLVVSGCSSSSSSAQATPSATPAPAPTTTPTPCPARPGKPFSWPAAMPQDLPKPPGSTFLSTTTSADHVTIVRLTSSMSLQQSVLFVLDKVNKAGFTLGRGDAEPSEADAPFGRGNVRGVYKMVARDSCVTDWLVATATVTFGNSPVLPTASRGPSSSPLPFG